MATEKNPQAAEILSAVCESSAEKKEVSSSEYDEDDEACSSYDTDDEEEVSSGNDVSSSSSGEAKEEEGNGESSEENDDPIPSKIFLPRRSSALKRLSDDYRKLFKEELMKSISAEDATKCLGKRRFKFVRETNPIPESFSIIDSGGFLILCWLTEGPEDKWLVDEENQVRLKFVLDSVRSQGLHFLCWAYVDCDLLSAARVLSGLDKEFVPLSPMFICRNICPDQYKEKREAGIRHCCFGMNLISGLVYAKVHGVPRERPEEVDIDCCKSEDFIDGEELYKVKEIYNYGTLESALQRLKSGYPVGASLMLFEGWDTYYKAETDDGMEIYEGPKPGKRYEHEHAVIIMDYRILRGKKVAICKLSNGLEVANDGYLAVSLEIMLSMVGANKKFRSNHYDNKPQHLLRDFFSVDVQMGVDPLVTMDPNEEETNNNFRVNIDAFNHNFPAPSYRSPAPTRNCNNTIVQLCSNLPASDYLFRLQTILLTDPQGAVNFAVMMSQMEGGCPVDFNTITDLFLQGNLIREATAFLLDVLKPNLPEHAFLQTKVLEINLVTFPNVADAILANGMFSHYDRPRVAQLCEKAGLYIQALKHYSELPDIKRVIANTHASEPQALVEILCTLSTDWAIECNLQTIVQACKEYCEQLGVDACMKLFEQLKSLEGLYFFLGSYLSMSDDPEIHFKYIEAAAKTGQIKDVERVTRESNFYDAEKTKNFLMEAKLPDARPLINVCDRFGFVRDLTHYLYTNNMFRCIEDYVQKVNPGNAPLVVGQLLDDECPEDFIKSLILSVRSLLPVEPLVEECEKRNRLCLLTQFLEHLVSEGSQDVHVHNALGKIIIDSNKNAYV